METKIIIDMLTQDGVSIRKQQYVTVNGEEYSIGEPWRKAYLNSVEDRKDLQSEINEPFLSAIMVMWGSAPTVNEKTTL
ncbi:hypothetical protein [Clostridium butyricum]|uniref:hypothetical protein n=1 Tax=Clostridium butyricum TaxID=1492 RepID=UPI00374E2D37